MNTTATAAPYAENEIVLFVDRIPAVVVADRLGRIVRANSAAGELFRRQEEYLMDLPLLELLPRLDLSIPVQEIPVDHPERDVCVRVELQKVPGDGLMATVTEIRAPVSRLAGAREGQDAYAAGMARLREERDKFHLIIENIADGVIVTDNAFRVIHSNTSSEAILGAGRERILHAGLEELCPEIFGSPLVAERLFYQKQEIAVADKVLLVYLAPLIIDNANDLNYALTIRDITHEKKLDEMKTQFVSNVSHELRTPLSSIKGFASTLLKRKNLTEDQKNGFLEIIDRESDRLTRLIEDLLSLSRMESGTFRLRLAVFDLAGLAREIREQYQDQFLAARIGFYLDVKPGLPEITADRDKIHQLFLNLISNALKFSPAGTAVTVSLDFVPLTEMFVLTVRDQGRGIARENLGKLFTKFFREEDKVHTIPGTGLGLSIVKTIAEIHGGQVTIESEVNEGTCFTVILPQKGLPTSM